MSVMHGDPTTPWQLDVLGPVALRRGAVPLPLPTHKLAALLVLLALGGPAHRARVASWLWPDVDDAAARRNLRRELARLRDAGAGTVLAAGEGAVLALSPDVDCDARALDAALDRAHDAARDGAGGPALESALESALKRWRGRPADGLQLDGCAAFDDWLGQARECLAAKRRRALQAAADAAEAAGDDAATVAWLEQLLADDPLLEATHRRLIARHLAGGRRAAALAQFARCQAVLLRELGIAPSAETEALGRQARDEPPGASLAPSPSPQAPAVTAAPHGQADLPFSGREAAWQQLQQAWAARRPVLIEGEGGIGKTRLGTEFAAAQGAFALAQCRAGDAALPYAAFKRALRMLAGPALQDAGLPAWVMAELAHVLPELGPASPRNATPEDRSRLHEAALAAWQQLASGSFDAVLIDDWHLADAESRHLFVALAALPAADDSPRLLLMLRPPADEEGRAACHALAAAGALHLRLEPLDEPALFALVQRLSGAAAPWRFTRRLQAATAGHPFFVAETLAHWQGLGLLQRGADGRWRTPFDEATDDYGELPLPAGVRDAVLARVQRQGETVRGLLETASLAGEPFGAPLLAAACAMSESQALAAIEQALAAGLLRELGGGFAFAHDLVQAALASTLAPERTRLAHRRLALAAEAAGLDGAEIARHWECGGEPRRAIPWRLAAAATALAIGSGPSAELHWAAVLAADPEPLQWVAVLRQRWPALHLRDDRPGLQALVDEIGRRRAEWQRHPASARAAVEAGVEQALLLSQGLDLHADRTAGVIAEELLATLAADDPLQVPLALARAQALNASGDHDAAEAVVEAALARPQAALTPRRQAQLLHTLAYSHFGRGRPQHALPYAERTLQVHRAAGDRRAQVRALANLGLMHSAIGAQGPAAAALEEARELARDMRLHDTHREVANNLADIRLTHGRPGEAWALADEALGLSPHWARPAMRVFLLGMRVQAAWQLGELGAARQAADEALAAALALGQPNPMIDALSMSLDLFSFVGDGAEAARRLALLDGLGGARSPHFEVKLAFNRVRLALAGGDTAAARQALARVGDPLALHEQRDREHAVLCCAELALAESDTAAARRWLDENPAPEAHAEIAARRALARLQAGDDGVAHEAAAQAAGSAHTPRPTALELHRALEQALAGHAPSRSQAHGDAARALWLAMRASLHAWPPWQEALDRRWAPRPS